LDLSGTPIMYRELVVEATGAKAFQLRYMTRHFVSFYLYP